MHVGNLSLLILSEYPSLSCEGYSCYNPKKVLGNDGDIDICFELNQGYEITMIYVDDIPAVNIFTEGLFTTITIPEAEINAKVGDTIALRVEGLRF